MHEALFTNSMYLYLFQICFFFAKNWFFDNFHKMIFHFKTFPFALFALPQHQFSRIALPLLKVYFEQILYSPSVTKMMQEENYTIHKTRKLIVYLFLLINNPWRLFIFEALKYDASWRAVFKRRRHLFQSKRSYSIDIFVFWITTNNYYY